MLKKIIAISGILFSSLSMATPIFQTGDEIVSRGNTEYSFSNNSIGVDHTSILLNFDLYIFDSWDGINTKNGNDIFGFRVNGSEYSWTFKGSYFEMFLNDPDAPVDPDFERGAFNEYDRFGPIDRFYDDFYGGFVIPHSSENLELVFFGTGLQGISDESWGITNLSVTTSNSVSLTDGKAYLLSDVSTPFIFGSMLMFSSFVLFKRKRI